MLELHHKIAAMGWALSPDLDESEFYRIAGKLGAIIHRADVAIRPESKSLVASPRALGIHTDHHKAETVGLYCVRQTDQGGETFLVDGRAALEELGRKEQVALRTVMLFEHKVFADDPEQWPLLNGEEGIPQIEEAEVEYKRYLTLCIRYPFPIHSIVPNKVMDTVWHYHILDTKAYHRDCEATFGHYFHHYPYFGLRGEEDARDLRNSFEKTKEYYLAEFGEPITHSSAAGDCWHDCENRCWHECKGVT